MTKAERRLAKEQEVINLMIRLYCRSSGHDDHCPQCRELRDYTEARNRACPFLETRSFCRFCEVHCYREDMRRRISEVMRIAGPRMLWHHPLFAFGHLLEGLRHRLQKGT
jgi:hypothetical protein